MTTREKELTELVRSLEWSGTDVYAGNEYACCPECGGLREEPADMHPSNRARCVVGHRPGCRLVAGLGEGEVRT